MTYNVFHGTLNIAQSNAGSARNHVRHFFSEDKHTGMRYSHDYRPILRYGMKSCRIAVLVLNGECDFKTTMTKKVTGILAKKVMSILGSRERAEVHIPALLFSHFQP